MSPISPGRYSARLIARTREDVTAALKRATSGSGFEQPGAARRKVIAWLKEHDTDEDFFRHIANENRQDAMLLLNAADQHGLAMQQLMENQVAYGALATLERSLIEGILTLCYIHDGDVTADKLMLRMLARTLDAFEGSHRTQLQFVRTFTAAKRRKGEANVAGVRELFQANGVILGPEHHGGDLSHHS